jgi:biopolymer transport protein ExbB
MAWRVFFCGCLFFLFLAGIERYELTSSQLFAQDNVAPEDAPAANAQPNEPAKPQQQSAVVWFLSTIGLIGYFLFALSMYFVALVARCFSEIRQQVAMPPNLVEGCDNLLKDKQFKEVYNTVTADGSMYAKLLSTGIAELPNGLSEARDAMERQEEALRGEMERKISMMAVLGTLGPMIGLLGTLKGMIASFSVIALSGTQLKSDEVAKGISEALLLTLLGVGLANPAIYFYALFRNRIVGICTNTAMAADEFVRHFAHAARANRPAAAAKGSGTPPQA